MIIANQFPARSKSFLSITVGTKIPLSEATAQKRSAIQISRAALRPTIQATVLETVTKAYVYAMSTLEQPPNTTATSAPETVRFSNEPAILCNFDPKDTSNLVRAEYTRSGAV